MYGDLAEKLLQDARRTTNLEQLPLYQLELVRAVSREIRELAARAAGASGSLDESNRIRACAYFVLQLCMRRNKRCVLAYEHQRADKIDQMVWSEVDMDSEASDNLSTHEQRYMHEYADLIADYKSEWSDFDLTGSLEPPREIYIEVRVLKDAGEVQTEYGAFNLKKDSQFFVRQSDVQRLIQQGFVQMI